MDPLSPPQTPTSPKVIRVGNWAAIVFILFILAVVLIPIGYFMIWPSYQNSQILKNGIQAEGTITAIEPTGNYYNDQPEAKIAVSVHPTSTGQTATFTTVIRYIVNPIYSPQLQPGKLVLIRYLPNDPSKATIEYIGSFSM